MSNFVSPGLSNSKKTFNLLAGDPFAKTIKNDLSFINATVVSYFSNNHYKIWN